MKLLVLPCITGEASREWIKVSTLREEPSVSLPVDMGAGVISWFEPLDVDSDESCVVLLDTGLDTRIGLNGTSASGKQKNKSTIETWINMEDLNLFDKPPHEAIPSQTADPLVKDGTSLFLFLVLQKLFLNKVGSDTICLRGTLFSENKRIEQKLYKSERCEKNNLHKMYYLACLKHYC